MRERAVGELLLNFLPWDRIELPSLLLQNRALTTKQPRLKLTLILKMQMKC